jgi:hypothetical protein
VEEVFNEEEVKEVIRLIHFLKEMNIPFLEDSDKIKIMGQILEMDLYIREVILKPINGNVLKIEYLGRSLIINVGERKEMIKIDAIITYKNGNLIISY